MNRPRSQLARLGSRISFFSGLLLGPLFVLSLAAQDEVARQLTPGQEPPPEEFPVPPAEAVDASSHLPGLPLWVTLTTMILVALLVALIIWAVLKYRKPRDYSVSSLASLTIARSRMQELQQLPDSTPLAEMGTRISLILRHYLADSQSDNALYQTHEEFNASEDRLQRLPLPLREELSSFLQELANVQYASPASNADYAKSLIAKGVTTLETVAQAASQESPTYA